MACNYQVEIVSKNDDKTVFTGPKKFTIRPRDVFSYELTFLPNAEQKFEVKFVYLNVIFQNSLNENKLKGRFDIC